MATFNQEGQKVGTQVNVSTCSGVKPNPISKATLEDVDCGLLLGPHDLFCEFYYTKAYSEPIPCGDRNEHENTPADVDIIKVCLGDKDGPVVTGYIYDSERLKSRIVDAYEAES